MGIQTALSCPRGQKRTWTATYTTPTNITGASFAFTVRDLAGNVLFQLTTGNGGIVITDAVNGVLAITGTAPQTLWPASPLSQSNQPPQANWDLWRTDSGSEDQIGYGAFTFTPSYRL